MAKLVYIGFPSPLSKVSCTALESGEDVPVNQLSRGICQDISVIPEKKGKYKLELEFEYDPSVLSNISNISISGTQDQVTQQPAAQDINSFDLNIPGLQVKPQQDGSISFSLVGEDGSTTEVNAEIPGMNVVKKDDGSVTFSMPQETHTSTTTTTKQLPQSMGSVRTTNTTTTITKTSTPATSTVVSGTMSIPRTQNINIKLPCPKQHQGNLKSACTGPDGASIPIQCTVVDDETVNLEFAPTSGNGNYSLNLLIADKVFPGCPIQMEVKGL